MTSPSITALLNADLYRDPPQKTAGHTKHQLITVLASDIEPKKVKWIWPGRIAIGKQTLIGGEPGVGKSQIIHSIVSRTTTGGKFPCDEGQAEQGNAIILAAEDSLEDTTIPRLEAAGANRGRVHLLMATRMDHGGERTFDLQADLDLLERKIAEIGGVSLVCIDPITSYLGNVDSHKNADLRRVLEPIGRMAERARVGIVSITHFAKPNGNGARALHRFIGSIAFVAAARMAFIAIEDPDDRDRVLFLEAKNNLASRQQGLAYRKLQRLVGPHCDIVASYIDWHHEPVSMTADEALGSGGHSDPTAKDDAIEFLQTILAAGPVPACTIEAEAREAGYLRADQRINQSKPFRAAKGELGIETSKSGMDGGWQWTLPKAPPMTEGALNF